MSINQPEAFHNCLWLLWFDICIETLNKVFVGRDEYAWTSQARKSSVTGRRCTGSKFDSVLQVTSYEVNGVDPSRVLSANDTKLKTNYLKVSKKMHDILGKMLDLTSSALSLLEHRLSCYSLLIALVTSLFRARRVSMSPLSTKR